MNGEYGHVKRVLTRFDIATTARYVGLGPFRNNTHCLLLLLLFYLTLTCIGFVPLAAMALCP